MKAKKSIKLGFAIFTVVLLAFLWWRYYFVFGEGVKAGTLNFVVKKGYLFKTWEGRLIQAGFKTPAPGALQSNEFEFSVVDDSTAQKLERASGKFVEVRYKEYLHTLPWRGMSNYVVTEVLRIENISNGTGLPF